MPTIDLNDSFNHPYFMQSISHENTENQWMYGHNGGRAKLS